MASDEYASGQPISDPVGSWTPPAKDGANIALPDARVTWAIEQISGARPTVGKWVKQARECDRFAAGQHFSDADKAALDAGGRMSAVFNAAQKWLRFISGVEDSSQIETRFLPRDLHSDPEGMAADLASKGISWALEKCDGSDERSRAFNDMVRRGMGWTNVLLNRADDVSGVIEMHRIDGMEMIWDQDSEKENLRDARWIARERQMPLKDACVRWPEFKDQLRSHVGDLSTKESPGTSTLFNEQSAVPVDEAAWPALKKGHVKITEFQWYEPTPGIYFYDPLEDKDDWLSEPEFEKYHRKYKILSAALRARANDPASDMLPDQRQAQLALPEELEHDRVLMNKYRQMLFFGKTELACSDLLGQRFTFNCITGQWDDAERIWYPFFKILLDPQRYMTKFANQIMEILVRSSKGGLLVEDGAVENINQFQAEYAAIGSVQKVNEGALTGNKIFPKPAVQLPQGSVEMFQVCNQLMKEVTGINPEVQMGMGAGDVSGVTQSQRQGAGLLLLAMEFRALRRYRKAEALTIFDFLRLIADNRWIRVGGAYDSQALQLMKEPFFQEYDVVLEEGTRDPAIRDGFWRDIKEMLPTFLRTGMFMPDLFDYMPLPASERSKFKKSFQAQQQQKAKMAEQGISDGTRGKATSVTEVKARERLVVAQAALTEAKAAKTMAEAQQVGQGDQGQPIVDAIVAGSEAGLKQAHAAQAMRHTEQKAVLDAQAEQRKAEHVMAKETIDTTQSILAGQMNLASIAAKARADHDKAELQRKLMAMKPKPAA